MKIAKEVLKKNIYFSSVWVLTSLLLIFILSTYFLTEKIISNFQSQVQSTAHITKNNYVMGDFYLMREQLNSLAKLNHWSSAKLYNQNTEVIWQLAAKQNIVSKDKNLPYFSRLTLAWFFPELDQINYEVKYDFPLYSSKSKNHQLGKLSIKKRIYHALQEKFDIIYGILVIYIIIWMIYIFLNYLAVKSTLQDLSTLKDLLKHQSMKVNLKLNENDENEVNTIIRWFDLLVDAWKSAQETSTQKSKLAGIGETSKQVAHDIRSPLAALDMVMKDITDIPESKRLMIREAVTRIHDIANELLYKNTTGISGEQQELSDVMGKYLISDILNSILSEKRMQYRDKHGISIEHKVDAASYGHFISVEMISFSRVISNLINNSVESIKGSNGLIEVSLSQNSQSEICITIKDNGVGIPAALINKLGAKGQSFNKKGGAGLGLSYAFTSIEKWGGRISITSKRGQGTTVTIALPKAENPKSFVDSIKIRPHSNIVILDDDLSVHQIWQGRLDSIITNDNKLKVMHFSNPDEFLAWYRDKDTVIDLFLVDYEYLGYELNGIDVIKKCQLSKESILVTSRYKEPHIHAECDKHHFKLLPKGLAGFVPMVIDSSFSKENPPQKILLDDDELVRLTWSMSAAKCNIPLQVFANSDHLISSLANLNKNSSFYIDSDLKEEKSGEDIAAELLAMGYENLYMASGYSADKFSHLKFLKGVIGKSPPWC